MLFSIVVPVYNSSNTIRDCLNSIASQDFNDYEVIIINDGSSDDTAQICSEYTQKYNNFKLFNFENEGVAVSRRRGIEHSNGDYIIFVDSDDSISKELLKNLSNTLLAHPNLDIIRYKVNLISDEPYKDHNRHNYIHMENTVLAGMEALKLWTNSKTKYAMYWLYAFKRTVFAKLTSIPTLKCYEDVAYIPLIIASANEVIGIDYFGYNYTCNRSDSLTNSVSILDDRNRAKDFFNACQFAIDQFCSFPFVTDSDIEFFKNDYIQRLKSFFDSMSADLQSEFAELYSNLL